MKNQIYQFLVKYHGNWDATYDAINKREKVKTDYPFRTNDNYIFILNENYHNKFKQILLPPFFYFYKGDFQFMDQQVIGIEGKISTGELDKIIKANSHNVICFNNNDLTKDSYDLLIAKGAKFIVICEGGIDSFKYEHNQNILLISEYDNFDDYQPCSEQTVERLLYAISDEIILGRFELDSWTKLISNLTDKNPKTIKVSDQELKRLNKAVEDFDIYSNYIHVMTYSPN